MKKLVEVNFSQPTPSSTTSAEITPEEEDILQYVAGYMVQKFRGRPGCESLLSVEKSGLVAALDRGGLTSPSAQFVLIVKELEISFRNFVWTSGQQSVFLRCIPESCRQDFFSLVDLEPDLADSFFSVICRLFFKVRMHQKCRQFVEQYVKAKKISRKTKPLRDSI